MYKSLISLLYSSSAEAQRLSAYTLRQIQVISLLCNILILKFYLKPLIGMVDTSSIVEPLLQLLRSLHISVQHEGILYMYNSIYMYM